MRKLLLFLVLFISVACTAQVTITNVTTSNYSTGGLAAFGGFTFTEGRMYIIFFGTSFTGSTPATVSLSGTGQTWTEVGTSGGALNTTSQRRIQAFRFAPASTNTNTVSVTYGGTGSQDGSFYYIIQITGCLTTGTNGSDGIIQAVTDDDGSADPTITLAALTNRSGVIMSFINENNPPAGTAESGWSEVHDGGYGTPNTGGYLMSITSSSDNTPTVTAASSNWAGIAIELKASGRRIVNVN